MHVCTMYVYKYNLMYLLCTIKARIRWCTCRVESILTFGIKYLYHGNIGIIIRMLTALSLGLHPRESGQFSTLIPFNHDITITYDLLHGSA